MGHLNYLAVPGVGIFEFLFVPVTTNHFPGGEFQLYFTSHFCLGVGNLTAIFWKMSKSRPMPRLLLPPHRRLDIDRCIIYIMMEIEPGNKGSNKTILLNMHFCIRFGRRGFNLETAGFNLETADDKQNLTVFPYVPFLSSGMLSLAVPAFDIEKILSHHDSFSADAGNKYRLI